VLSLLDGKDIMYALLFFEDFPAIMSGSKNASITLPEYLLTLFIDIKKEIR
jgi:hypothetical protein